MLAVPPYHVRFVLSSSLWISAATCDINPGSASVPSTHADNCPFIIFVKVATAIYYYFGLPSELSLPAPEIRSEPEGFGARHDTA